MNHDGNRASIITKKVLAAWLFLLIGGVAAFYFFYYANQVDELEQTEQALTLEQQRQMTLERTIEEQNDIEPTTMEQLLVRLPEGLGEEHFIEVVEQAASRHRISVDSYGFEPPTNVPEEQGQGVIQQTITINGTSSSARLVEAFVQELETAERMIHVTRLSYQQVEVETTFQLQVIIYGAGKIVLKVDE